MPDRQEARSAAQGHEPSCALNFGGNKCTCSAAYPSKFGAGAKGTRESSSGFGPETSAAQDRPETLDEFMARHEHVLVSNSVKRIAYATGRPIDRILAGINRAQEVEGDA